MKKRIFSLALTGAIGLSMLTACGGGAASSGSALSKAASDSAATSSVATGGSISIMASQEWVKDAEQELAAKFTEETGIKVDYQIVPADQYPNLLMTKLNSGECSDIFMNQSGTFDIESQMQVSKNAVDLSDEAWASRFQPAVKEQVSFDGKLYGITIWDQGDSYAYVYNKKIFTELGLEEPTTFEEFKAVCDAISKSGVTPIFENVASGWHHTLPFAEAAGAYNAADASMVEKLNNNETTFAQQEVFATVLKQYKEIVDAGYWGEDYMSNVFEDTGTAMASGDYAMTVNMMGRVTQILEEDTNLKAEDFGFFPYPYGDNKIIAATPCGPSKFIYSGSKNIELAKQYFDFLASEESLKYMIENEISFNSMPFEGLSTTFSDEIVAARDKYMDESMSVYQNVVKYYNPQWMEIGQDLTSLLLGEMNEAQVLESLDKRRSDQATAAGDEKWG